MENQEQNSGLKTTTNYGLNGNFIFGETIKKRISDAIFRAIPQGYILNSIDESKISLYFDTYSKEYQCTIVTFTGAYNSVIKEVYVQFEAGVLRLDGTKSTECAPLYYEKK